jgi:hypothetical protein
MLAANAAEPTRQLGVIGRGQLWFESREFLKLRHASAHHETTPRVRFRLIPARRRSAPVGYAFVIIEDRFVRKGERVPGKIELWPVLRCRRLFASQKHKRDSHRR